MMVGMFCLGFGALLHLFRGGPDPDVPDYRCLGRPRPGYAAFKLFSIRFSGPFLMLPYTRHVPDAGTTAIRPSTHEFPESLQHGSGSPFASFAVKVPMWPVHTWLPDAHVEAPTAGSVILADVLLKFEVMVSCVSLPMFPIASVEFAPLIYSLSVVAVIYTSWWPWLSTT